MQPIFDIVLKLSYLTPSVFEELAELRQVITKLSGMIGNFWALLAVEFF